MFNGHPNVYVYVDMYTLPSFVFYSVNRREANLNSPSFCVSRTLCLKQSHVTIIILVEHVFEFGLVRNENSPPQFCEWTTYLQDVKAPAFASRYWIFDSPGRVRVRSHRAALFFVLKWCYVTRCSVAFQLMFGQTERKVVPCGRIFLSNAIPDQIRIGWTVVEGGLI